jgi:periplasmic glucans biosynthesis protein
MSFQISSTFGDPRPRICSALAMLSPAIPKQSRIRRLHAGLGLWLLSAWVGACGGVSARPDAPAATAARDAAEASARKKTPAEPPEFFSSLVERARGAAGRAYVAPAEVELPGALGAMNYDQYRSIRFRPERSLWRGEPGRFEVQFFHMGFSFHEPVTVHVVEANDVAPFPFSADLFTYDLVPKPSSGVDIGFAGLRVHAPINRDTYRDEIIVFQGASYFRSLGRDQVYGLSARALAIDLGEPTPEEFPRFTDLYLVRPGAGENHVWVLALLDGPSATGAYAFRVEPASEPNPDTRIEVTARVFVRANVAVLGIAPLTSMFLFGEEEPARFGDFRPEVHDSDSLALWSKDGEHLLRSLRNPSRMAVCSFRLDSPVGFGLLQRDRAFANYQDLEARYQDRPSAWIEPLGDWGPGVVRLLEIPSDREVHDNIAIAWVPDAVPADGLTFRYRMHLGREVPSTKPVGRVTAARLAATLQGTRFLVDFEGEPLTNRERDVKVEVWASSARVLEQHVERNPFTKGWRASFELAADANPVDVELRASLHGAGSALSETWSYLWQPTQ